MKIRLSSYKKNYGLEELLSKDQSLYWYTDGNLPHFIEISFSKRTFVERITLFLNFSRDDSYTPDHFEILIGDTKDTLQKFKSLNLVEPEGLIDIDINLSCIYIYVIILKNCQEGRDSHIRHLSITTKYSKDIKC